MEDARFGCPNAARRLDPSVGAAELRQRTGLDTRTIPKIRKGETVQAPSRLC